MRTFLESSTIVTKENGIRPAGPQDRCLYCKELEGTPHKGDCVCVVDGIELEIVFAFKTTVPHSWSKEEIAFYFNESSHCMDNVLDIVGLEVKDKTTCCCNLNCYVREV